MFLDFYFFFYFYRKTFVQIYLVMWYIFLLKFELAKSKFYLLSETQVSSLSLTYFETFLVMQHFFLS